MSNVPSPTEVAQDRTTLTSEYRDRFPILDAFLTACEYSTPGVGIDVAEAAGIALDAIGRPGHDGTDRQFAAAYVRRLLDEIDDHCPRTPHIGDVVTDALGEGGDPNTLPTAQEWLREPDEERAAGIEQVLHLLPGDTAELKRLFGEALAIAMPALLDAIVGPETVPTEVPR